MDYEGILPNPSLVNLDRSRKLTANILLTWLLRPGTAFYGGYTDVRENLALFPGSGPGYASLHGTDREPEPHHWPPAFRQVELPAPLLTGRNCSRTTEESS